jgi:hypothetical protein
MLEQILAAESADSIVFIPTIDKNEFVSALGYEVMFYRDNVLSQPTDQLDPRLWVLTDIMKNVHEEIETYKTAMSLFSSPPDIVQVLKDIVRRKSYRNINLYVFSKIQDKPGDAFEEINNYFNRAPSEYSLAIPKNSSIKIPLGDFRDKEQEEASAEETSGIRRKTADFLTDKIIGYWLSIPPRKDMIHDGLNGCYSAMMGLLAALVVTPLVAAGAGEVVGNAAGMPLAARCVMNTGLAAAGAVAAYKYAPAIVTDALFAGKKFRNWKREKKISKLEEVSIPSNIKENDISQLGALCSYSKAMAKSVYTGHLDTSIDIGAAFIKEVITPFFWGMGLPLVPKTDMMTELAYAEKKANPKAPDIRNSQTSIAELDYLRSNISRTSLRQEYKAALIERIDKEIHGLQNRIESISYSDAFPFFNIY